MNHETNVPRGFGFVTFKSLDSVQAVLDAYHDHFLQEKWIETKLCLPDRPDRGAGGYGNGGNAAKGPGSYNIHNSGYNNNAGGYAAGSGGGGFAQHDYFVGGSEKGSAKAIPGSYFGSEKGSAKNYGSDKNYVSLSEKGYASSAKSGYYGGGENSYSGKASAYGGKGASFAYGLSAKGGEKGTGEKGSGGNTKNEKGSALVESTPKNGKSDERLEVQSQKSDVAVKVS